MIISSILLLLLSNAVTLRRDKYILYSRISMIILLYSCLIGYNNLDFSLLENGLGLFGGLFHATCITNVFHIFILLLSSIILVLTAFYPRNLKTQEYSSLYKLIYCKLIYYETSILNKMAEQYKIIEYPLILLFIVTGALFLMSTNDLVSIFLSIELQSYGLYLLSTIYRNSESATSGGLMYFLLGGLSSCFILLSTSLLYANSGTTSLLLSSLISLIIGTVVGLRQFRIKRLYAYSTISHVGFILLSLSIHSVESIQAFIFYIIQYSISNLNAFILLISIGYSLYCYVYEDKKEIDTKKYTNNEEVVNKYRYQDENTSPIQLISQLKGYYYINPMMALSLCITLFSFVGVPPLIGFFGKQMILSAALDNGYIFMSLVAILTSVISAVYYLFVIKQIFFEKPSYKLNPVLNDLSLNCVISNGKTILKKTMLKVNNIVISSSLSVIISILTLIILLFIFIPQE